MKIPQSIKQAIGRWFDPTIEDELVGLALTARQLRTTLERALSVLEATQSVFVVATLEAVVGDGKTEKPRVAAKRIKMMGGQGSARFFPQRKCRITSVEVIGPAMMVSVRAGRDEILLVDAESQVIRSARVDGSLELGNTLTIEVAALVETPDDR